MFKNMFSNKTESNVEDQAVCAVRRQGGGFVNVMVDIYDANGDWIAEGPLAEWSHLLTDHIEEEVAGFDGTPADHTGYGKSSGRSFRRTHQSGAKWCKVTKSYYYED